MQIRIEELRTRVDAVLRPEGEEDQEALLLVLDNAVAAAPDEPELRRLRIRAAQAGYEYRSEHADRLALLGLVPDDRENALELALLQHRYAEQLTAVELGAESPAAPDDAAKDAAARALKTQAVAWLVELFERYREDATFCMRLLQCWRAGSIHSPWTFLRLVLQAATAHRDDNHLILVLAQAWQELAGEAPSNFDPDSNKVPSGFLLSFGGQLCDPFASARAIACYSDFLRVAPGHAAALNARAELYDTLYDLPAAAKDYAAAADAFERLAASVTPQERALFESGRYAESSAAAGDLLERVAAAASAEAARERAAQCAGGRAGQQAGALAAIEQALAKLRQAPQRPRSGRPQVDAYFDDLRQQQAHMLEGLEAQLAAVAGSFPPSQPDAACMARMRATAEKVAAKLIKALPTEPQPMLPIAPAQFEGDWLAQFEPFCIALRAAGWRELGWLEWPKYRAVVGRQCVSTQWTDDVSGAVAIAFGMPERLHVDIETELEDGRQVVSSVSRGANFLTYGGDIDMLFVERSLPPTEIGALHRAYVDWVRGPAVPRRMRTLEDMLAMQRRGGPLKLRYRLQHGIGHYETLGMHSDYPEIFGPLVQAAFQAQLEPLRSKLTALLAVAP